MFSLSVAMLPDKGIGFQGKLPWHIKEELQLFKENTLGKTIIMGQTTYDNLPGPLPGRKVMVVSNDPSYNLIDVEIITDLIFFLEAHKNDSQEYIICGGASIYKQAYPYCQKAYVSMIKETQPYNRDTWFHAFNLNDWKVIATMDYDEFTYLELKRKPEKLTLVRFSEHELEFSDGTILRPAIGDTYDRTVIEDIMRTGD